MKFRKISHSLTLKTLLSGFNILHPINQQEIMSGFHQLVIYREIQLP